MIKKIKLLLMSVVAASAFVLPLAVPAVVSAQDIQDGLRRGTCLNVNDPNCSNTANSEERVNKIIADVINIFSIVVGVVAVIMIIVGGFKYITSAGEASNVTGAKNTVLFALVGLIVVALAQFIVRFVLDFVSQ